MCLKLSLVFKLVGLVVIAFNCIGRRANSFLTNTIINNISFTIASVYRWFFAVRKKVYVTQKELIKIIIFIEVFFLNSVVLLVRPLRSHCSRKAVAANTVVGK